MENYDVAVVRCKTYDVEAVKPALEEAVNAVNGLDFVKSGMKIIIKPNLVSFKKPDAAATTHPALLEALVEMLLARGADVTIGDSPGGPHSLPLLNRVYAATGMDRLEKLGAKLNRNMNEKTVDFPEGKVLKNFTYTEYLDEADAIIDFCKLKSHGMLGMSAAVKNLFGTIPGLKKPEVHYKFQNDAEFADMLVDLNEYFKPRLAICDAVVGMEGNGPTAGTPRQIGAIIASKSTYYADVVGAELIGMNIDGLPTLQAAYERGFAPSSSKNLRVYGDIRALTVDDFKAPPVRGLSFMRKGNVLHFISKAALEHKPTLKKRLCVGCGECARMCPAKAIEMKNKKPHINREKCIRCFCCQEFCPRAAMVAHRPLAAKALNKLKL
ncbi:MAG TPA: iron-sulfur protein [Clostridiales bacterium]|nr:iron-sulfur protein [Clostridiales bacterium]